MNKDDQWLLEEKYAGAITPAFEADKARLACGEPLAYVIGHQPFLELKIYLDSHPLIPRIETEWWVERLIEHIGNEDSGVFRSATARAAAIFQRLRLPMSEANWKTRSALVVQENTRPPKFVADVRPLRFLDLCAGSGAIGCAALKSLPYMEVSFGEIDPAHEATILKNIRGNNLDASRADVRIGDLFGPFGNEKFDVIAVNPPYIPSVRQLEPSVADHEPTLALFAEEDGLGVIRRIAKGLPEHLARGGEAWIECDSAHAAAACALFTDQGLHAEIRTDQYDAPRILVITFP